MNPRKNERPKAAIIRHRKQYGMESRYGGGSSVRKLQRIAGKGRP